MDKIRCQADKPGQIAGQLAHDCGREMHTSGSLGRLDIFKFVAAAFITTSFEHFVERDSAGQKSFRSPKTGDRNQIVVDFQSQRNSLNGPRVSAASATRK